MLSLLRNRLGIPGVIAIIALVFAMFGGAYAATDNSGGAKASAKGKKGPRGKPGKPGKPGPAGPQGPQGPAGANGKDGANGAQGPAGSAGPAGPAGAKGPTGPTGPGGATGLTGPTGTAGATGPTGSPWVPENELPSGAMLTGSWSVGHLTAAQTSEDPFSPIYVPISFPIPLGVELPGSAVHILYKGDPATTECPGSVSDPEAQAGHLCVYTTDQVSPPFHPANEPNGKWLVSAITKATSLKGGETGASKTGAFLNVLALEKGVFAYGVWAVTAP